MDSTCMATDKIDDVHTNDEEYTSDLIEDNKTDIKEIIVNNFNIKEKEEEKQLSPVRTNSDTVKFNLNKYWKEDSTMQIHKWTHYPDIYHENFDEILSRATVDRPLIFMEVGVDKGGSIKMWQHFLKNTPCKIYAADIESKVQYQSMYDNENPSTIFINNPDGTTQRSGTVELILIDQSDAEAWKKLIESGKIPSKFDIFLDDGSHVNSHLITTQQVFYPHHISEGGVYLVEDTHTSYLPYWGGCLRNPSTYIEHCKRDVDKLHGHFINMVDDITLFTHSIKFYDSIVVYKKKNQEQIDRGPSTSIARTGPSIVSIGVAPFF